MTSPDRSSITVPILLACPTCGQSEAPVGLEEAAGREAASGGRREEWALTEVLSTPNKWASEVGKALASPASPTQLCHCDLSKLTNLSEPHFLDS